MSDTLINLWTGSSGLVDSDRAPDEILRALAKATDEEKFSFAPFGSGYAGDKAIISKIKDSRFKLRYRIFYRNSFARELDGVVESHGGGSHIKYKLQMPLSVRVFMGFWLAFVGVTGGLALAIKQPTEPACLIPAGMFLFGLALPFIGQKIGSGNEQKMEQLVRNIAVGID